MHELSIAQSILEIVLREAEKQKPARVVAVGLKIGALSGIYADSLEFGFDAIKMGTPLEECRLEIEEVAIRGQCHQCGHVFDVRELLFACPLCASGSIELKHGQELDIAYIEIDEETEDWHVK